MEWVSISTAQSGSRSMVRLHSVAMPLEGQRRSTGQGGWYGGNGGRDDKCRGRKMGACEIRRNVPVTLQWPTDSRRRAWFRV